MSSNNDRNGGGSSGSNNNANKLLFWFVSRPRRMKINCCFVFSQSGDTDSMNQEAQGTSNASRRNSSSSKKSSPSKRNSNQRRRVIRREDIGLPTDFQHISHLGPDSDLTNAHQLSIVCSNL